MQSVLNISQLEEKFYLELLPMFHQGELLDADKSDDAELVVIGEILAKLWAR